MTAHVRMLKPYAMPKGTDPRVWRQSVEKRLNDLLDRALSLITALDLMEADVDLEETADDELTLGWTASGPRGGTDNTDREADDAELEEGGDEHEPSLGWSIGMDQDVALRGAKADVTFFDGEQDAGDSPEQPEHN
ncbi:hypothetical protein [Mesorhizobium sp. LNJC394B00]|uniref:hypothetical protein n=1 Tax=Mesorhizobium sp. LNJC394B00 TaxID=1287274 RepID=UPI0003CF119E|nr:hypothetical protein [Mesorhizobium sp. LNJC394B00]ESY15194.1 hypothetical protein X750_29315 [Mesorhizobium sp. LNJC394B00]